MNVPSPNSAIKTLRIPDGRASLLDPYAQAYIGAEYGAVPGDYAVAAEIAESYLSDPEAFANYETRVLEEAYAEQYTYNQLRQNNLSGIPNQRALRERLSTMIWRKAPEDDVVLFGLDLDRFKLVNEILTHEVADELLITIAQRLDAGVRRDSEGADEVMHLSPIATAEDGPDQLAGHVGGDEFAVIALFKHIETEEDDSSSTDEDAQPDRRGRSPKTAADKIKALKARIKREVGGVIAENEALEELADFGIGVSVGVAVWQPGMRIDTLLREADIATYQDKRENRQRVLRELAGDRRTAILGLAIGVAASGIDPARHAESILGRGEIPAADQADYLRAAIGYLTMLLEDVEEQN